MGLRERMHKKLVAVIKSKASYFVFHVDKAVHAQSKFWRYTSPNVLYISHI